jgi:hypothetical protein
MYSQVTEFRRKPLFAVIVSSLAWAASHSAQALELDWGGQFRAENHFIYNYNMDSANLLPDPTRSAAGGYYIPGGGSQIANFQTLFMRLNPNVIVNDNIFIKSEWWVGDPVFGVFGNGTPYSADQRQWLSTFTRGAPISAQRFWAEILTDIGTVQVGRAPLDWGLGLVYHSGNGVWDRYMSTGDLLRMVTKFGAFSFIPQVVHYGAGNTIGGACYGSGATCSPVLGSGDAYDFSIAFRYDNTDEDFDAGVIYTKRLTGSAQDPVSGYLGVGTVGATTQPVGSANINLWDLYGKKRLGNFHFGVEVPIVSGQVSSINYTTFAVAAEVKWNITDSWSVWMKGGYAPGQNSFTQGGTQADLSVFYFHPNYRLGMIMFNYQLASFAGPQTQNNPNLPQTALASPFYNPITNAYYGLLGGAWKPFSKLEVHTGVIAAGAPQVAQAGQTFFNHWERRFVNASFNQSNFLGVETDLGATYRWDEHFDLRLDLGLWVPGQFYAFSNTATQNQLQPIFAGQLGLGITF